MDKLMKYRRMFAEINLDFIALNTAYIRKIVPNDTDIMAIVKADAYGHGAVEVAKIALYNGASSLGVAILEEGAELRLNYIFVPILILGYTPSPLIPEVVRLNLIQTVFHYEMAVLLSNEAVKQNKIVDVHIKIDTGMSRLGFPCVMETADEILKISSLPNVNIDGIYTHLATSDNANSDFVHEQQNLFINLLSEINKLGINPPCVHIANSGGILHYPELLCKPFNTVRAGIILYGLSPFDKPLEGEFKPSMSVKSRVSYVKELREDVSVGYGRTYFTDKITRVATIPVGYADGYLRAFSNCGHVLIDGFKADVIGVICMDQFMVDVTDNDMELEGVEVVLLGSSKDKTITAEELGAISDTINYEIVCNVGKRVPRVYIKNGEILKITDSL